MRIFGTLTLAASLLLPALSATAGKTPAKKADSTITCPFMHKKVAKSKAIKVTAANGKSMYVCCKGCVEPAKKQLMASGKKASNDSITCPFMHKTVAMKDAVKVTAANGKSMYVCCQGCEEPAKKQLMAKK
jgi:hypothetical protein